MKTLVVYIMTNKRNGTLYTGVTSNLIQRIYQHKNSITKGFTTKYGCRMLVFYCMLDTMENAIAEEKGIKFGSREQKIAMIEKMNPSWRDLWEDIVM